MPRAVDLFCGAFGTTLGYARALPGWEIDAVDLEQRADPPHPAITFHRADATTWSLDGYDLVLGSPPCTGHSTRRTAAEPAGTEWMLAHTIDRFRATGLPYVIENVPGARSSMAGAFELCGSMFGLVDGPYLLERHRLFLTNRMIMAPGPHRCRGRGRIAPRTIGVYGDMTANDRRCDGRRSNRPNGDMRAGIDRARRLMGMPWADGEGLALAIPPAYTEWIGGQLLAQMEPA